MAEEVVSHRLDGKVVLAVLFLSSDASRFITGTELTVDGGFTAV